MSTPSPPDEEADPAEVRTWLTKILTSLHDVPLIKATEIAAKWEYGRGSEITYYDVETYRKIFGPEAGTILFGHARRELGVMKRGPSGGRGEVVDGQRKDFFRLKPGLILVYIFFIATLFFGYSAWQVVYHAAEMYLMTLGSMAGFIISYLLFYFGSRRMFE